MNQCDYVMFKLQDYLDGSLLAEERLRLDKHLGACADCRQSLEMLRQTDALLGKWEDVEPSAGFLDAVNRRTGGVSQPESKSIFRHNYLRRAVAVAAVLLIGAVILLVTINREPDKEKPANIPVSPVVVPTAINPDAVAGLLEQGVLLVQQENQQTWQEMKTSGTIANNDTVKTENNRALLSLADKTQVEIGRNTVFSLKKTVETGRGVIYLREGSIYLNVTHGSVPLYVETPAGRIKITGTALRVDHQKYSIMPRISTRENYALLRKGKSFSDARMDITVVAVDEGSVVIEYKGSPQDLTAGERAAFSSETKPVKIEVPASINTNEPEGLKKAVYYYLGLMGELSEKNDVRRIAVIEAILQSYGDRIIPYLLLLLKLHYNESVEISHYKPIFTGRVLGRMGSEDLYGELAAIAQSPEYPESNRMAAAGALIAINQPSGSKIVMDILKNAGDTTTKQICISILKFWDKTGYETNSEFINILTGIIKQGVAGNELFEPAVQSLSGINDPSVLKDLYEIFDNEQDYLIAIPAARSIFLLEGRDCYVRILPKLNKLAEDDDDIVKLSVMKTIMEIEGPDAEERLLPRVHSIASASTEVFVKFTALEVAHYFRYERSVDIFMDVISAVSGNDKLLNLAIRKTAEFGTPESVEILAQASKRLIMQWMQTQHAEDDKAATLMLEALRQVENPKTLPAFREMLRDTEPDFVLSAVLAMAKMGEKSDVPALTRLLDSGGFDDYLQNEIRHAIDEIEKRTGNE